MSATENRPSQPHQKVLVFAEAWGLGGIETFIMNVLRGLSSSEFQFEILTIYDWDTSYDEELADLRVGRKSIFSGVKPTLVRRFLSGTSAFAKILRENDFDVVHINIMNGVGLVYAQIAKRLGVPKVIVHSHNSSFGSGHTISKTLAHRVTRSLLASQPDLRLACSEEAGQYLFGSRDFHVINNGINTAKFKFNPDDRSKIRNALSIAPNALVVGTIGRLDYQKNPLFQIGIMSELIRLIPDAVFLHVGDGEMRSEVESACNKTGIAENCRFVTRTLSPQKYLSAMDRFIFPSLYEGLGIAPIEAQCNGVTTYLSDRIPRETIITDVAKRIPLDSTTSWAIQIATPQREYDRAAYSRAVKRSNFDVDDMVNEIRSIYS